MTDTRLSRVGGVVLAAASVAFMVVFSMLAGAMGYPDVLDHPAGEVLPMLVAGGAKLRLIWAIYAVLPVAFAVAGIASLPVMRLAGRGLATLGAVAAVAAAAAMTLGLMRWSSLNWALAANWGGASADARASLSAVFDGGNLYLGTYLGEFIGETCAATWFAIVGLGYLQARRRIIGTAGLVAAALTAVAAFRNMTGAVDPVAMVNNFAMPLWMIALGVAMFLVRLPTEDGRS